MSSLLILAFDLDKQLSRDRPLENPAPLAPWIRHGELAVVIHQLPHCLALVNRWLILLNELRQ